MRGCHAPSLAHQRASSRPCLGNARCVERTWHLSPASITTLAPLGLVNTAQRIRPRHSVMLSCACRVRPRQQALLVTPIFRGQLPVSHFKQSRIRATTGSTDSQTSTVFLSDLIRFEVRVSQHLQCCVWTCVAQVTQCICAFLAQRCMCSATCCTYCACAMLIACHLKHQAQHTAPTPLNVHPSCPAFAMPD